MILYSTPSILFTCVRPLWQTRSDSLGGVFCLSEHHQQQTLIHSTLPNIFILRSSGVLSLTTTDMILI